MVEDEIQGTKVGLRERDSLLFCTICNKPITIKLEDRIQIVGYITDESGEWGVDGVYCERCEPMGGTIDNPTEGVDELVGMLTIHHKKDTGTIVDGFELMAWSNSNNDLAV